MVCGQGNSFELQFHATEHGLEAQVQADALWQGYPGVLHGGMICTLLDAAMTHCLFHQGIEAMTAELQVRFLNPVPCKELLILRATLLSSRRHLYKLNAELSCAGEVLARGEARFMQRNPA